MNTLIKQITLSILSGASSTFVYLGLSHFLDHFMNPKYSNFISLLVGAIINFLFQSYSFAVKNNHVYHLPKYFIAELFIIGFSQFGVIYLLNKKQRYKKKLPLFLQYYYNTVSRIIVACLVFIFFSFPMRKLWVFT